MGIKDNIEKFREELKPFNAKLIAVSKTHPVESVREAYDAGQRIFGENKVQEMSAKQPLLSADVDWHLIGHLQRNKVKYIAPFVSCIHSVDSMKLLEEVNKQGEKSARVVHCLLQVYIAREETKFGLDVSELNNLLRELETTSLKFVAIDGLMGMATLTEDQTQIRNEFRSLRQLFEEIKRSNRIPGVVMKELSMGMSADYKIALDEGSTMVRIGTSVFGERKNIT